MFPQFSSLSHEIILQIVDLLLEDDDDESDEDRYYSKVETSELKYSGKEAIFNLSRTSTFFHRLLSPYLFRRITLSNSEKSGRAVQYLCSTNQIANIKTLHFKSETSAKKEEDFHDVESVFPAEVNDVLSNLSRFPHLATLIIDLDLDDHWAEAYEDLWMLGGSESEEEIEKAEEQKRWRALIKKTLEAISKTCSDSVREFVFKQCPIRTNSVFGSAPFNEWLGKLKSFRFEPHGCTTHEGRLSHITPQFRTYINNLDHCFFDAIENVTRLAIVGNEEAIIGQTFRGAPLPLRTTHVPKLRELELGYYAIQDDLLDFLMAHSSTLEHLTFNHSFVDYTKPPGSGYESPGPWKSWFQNYASREPRALRNVTFMPDSVPTAPYDCSADIKLSVKMGRFNVQRKAEKKEHRMFLYGSIEENVGGLAWMNDLITERAREEDLDGWCDLMAVVNRNRVGG